MKYTRNMLKMVLEMITRRGRLPFTMSLSELITSKAIDASRPEMVSIGES